MDYSKHIDAETWDFINKTAEYYPPDTVESSIEQQREIYDTMCRAFFTGYPDGVSATDEKIGHIPTRQYTCGGSETTVMYFHGGGFVVGGLDSHDDVCAEICERTGMDVVSVDYRMAPEHKHPAMFDDCLAATKHILATREGTVILAGDSAGGNLGATVSHRLRNEPRLIGQVLIYPGLGGDIDAGSFLTHANAPMLTRDEILFYEGVRYDGPKPTNDPTAVPLQDTDFSNLPPTVLISAECDPITDGCRDYRDALTAAGCKVVWFNETGLIHGYLRGRHTVKRARDSFDRVIAALNALRQRDWPY
ncbi:alpha/beta hydrolase [Neptunicoccus cionae]|uniref:alpha/beta hydrolase n=1 Tax=Neptunicoccus cionae TaxID=2035344 RepID=UPI000C7643A1|nr:alpha/beta hydrolase [Amylibacter cionae]PLS22249.1 esterase [Amylibacter cionae]